MSTAESVSPSATYAEDSIRILKGAYYLLSTLNRRRTYRAWKKRRNDIIAKQLEGGDDNYNEANISAMHPMNRLGRPEEMAEAALYLASDAAAFITGHALVSDGGWLANGY